MNALSTNFKTKPKPGSARLAFYLSLYTSFEKQALDNTDTPLILQVVFQIARLGLPLIPIGRSLDHEPYIFWSTLITTANLSKIEKNMILSINTLLITLIKVDQDHIWSTLIILSSSKGGEAPATTKEETTPAKPATAAAAKPAVKPAVKAAPKTAAAPPAKAAKPTPPKSAGPSKPATAAPAKSSAAPKPATKASGPAVKAAAKPGEMMTSSSFYFTAKNFRKFKKNLRKVRENSERSRCSPR